MEIDEFEKYLCELKCPDCMFGGACDYCPEHPYTESPNNVEKTT